MVGPAPRAASLRITPALEHGDAGFLAGFSRHPIVSHDRGVSPTPGRVVRIWPGQPAVPSPWVPCAGGCCLVLASTDGPAELAGQWLRFLIDEFLGEQHRVDGWVEVPGVVGAAGVLLIVEGSVVFEGVMTGQSGNRAPRAIVQLPPARSVSTSEVCT